MASVDPAVVSPTQRRFLDAAESLGALSPAAARPLPDWPRLSARELGELIERGLIREASDSLFYAYAPRQDFQDPTRLGGSPRASRPLWSGRAFQTLMFWLVALLIPAVFLFFMRS
jgi:hypothetical protein